MVVEAVKIYTVKELCSIWNTVDNVVRKKIDIHRLSIDKQVIKGRLTTVVKINNSKLDAIKQEIEENKNIYKQDGEQSFSGEVVHNEQYVNQSIKDSDTVLIMREFAYQLNSTYELVNEKDKVINEKDKQIYMLEDLQNRQKQDVLAKQSENTTLSKRYSNLRITLITVASILFVSFITVLVLYINKLQNPTIVEKIVVKEIIKQVPAKAPVKKYRRR